jgi:hypothetical protein
MEAILRGCEELNVYYEGEIFIVILLQKKTTMFMRILNSNDIRNTKSNSYE